MDCTRFGNKLNYYRERNDMTERDLARKLGVTVRTVEKWENSEAVPNDRIIQKLSEMFGVDFWNYLDLDDKHGGSHDFDDEGDLSPFEIIKAKRAEKTRPARQSKSSGSPVRTNTAPRKRNTGSQTSGSVPVRKLASIILAVLAVLFFILDDFIFYDLFYMPELSYLSIPIVILLLALSSIIGRKK